MNSLHSKLIHLKKTVAASSPDLVYLVNSFPFYLHTGHTKSVLGSGFYISAVIFLFSKLFFSNHFCITSWIFSSSIFHKEKNIFLEDLRLLLIFSLPPYVPLSIASILFSFPGRPNGGILRLKHNGRCLSLKPVLCFKFRRDRSGHNTIGWFSWLAAVDCCVDGWYFICCCVNG